MPPKRKQLASNPDKPNPVDTSPETRPATRQTPVYPPVPPGSNFRPQGPGYSAQGFLSAQATVGGQGHPAATRGNMGLGGLVAPEIQYHTPHSHQPTGHSPTLLRPAQPRPELRPPPPMVTPVPIPRTPSLSNQPPADRPLQPPQSADRNIDKVVLGDLCFRTWYPSYYGKEILDVGGGSGKGGGKEETGRKDQHPVLGMLYVCPHCFKYSKELVAWGGHVRVCGRKDEIPGRKVYVHPRGERKIQVAQPQSASGGPGKRKRGDGGMKYIEEFVKDEGEWGIWEVDGEYERVSSRLPAKESHD